MAEYQHGGFRIAFNHFSNACERAQHRRHQQVRTRGFERAVRRSHDHQQAFAALKLQVGVFDGSAQTRFVFVQPGLSDFWVWHRDDVGSSRFAVFSSAAERPPPVLFSAGSRCGRGRHGFWLFSRGVFLRAVRAERPPIEAAVFFGVCYGWRRCGLGNHGRSGFFIRGLGRYGILFIDRSGGVSLIRRAQLPPFVATFGVILWSLCATGDGQAQGQGEGLIR